MTETTWELAVVGGPDAGRAIGLAPGRRSLGRARDGLVVHDPSIEPHHVVVEVAEEVRCVQVAGRTRVLVDSVPLGASDPLRAGALLRVGCSLLRLRRCAAALGGGELDSGAVERWPVTLGIADATPLPPLPPADASPGLTLEMARGDARRRPASEPISVDLSRLDRFGVTGAHRRSAARSMLSAVTGAARPPDVVSFAVGIDDLVGPGACGLIVVADLDAIDAAEAFLRSNPGGDPRALVVLAEEEQDLPVDCRARLVIGETWRGMFVADIATGFDDVVRLHVAGCSEATAASRLARSARGTGSLVAEEIARSAPQRRRRVVGVPQPA